MLAVPHAVVQQSGVVLGHVLFLSTSNGVVMLHHTHGFTEELEFLGVGLICEHRKLLGDLEEVVADTLIVLEGRPGGEVTSPESVRIARVGEEVIGLRRPLDVLLVQSLVVAGRSRVEGFVVRAVTLVYVPGDCLFVKYPQDFLNMCNTS